MIPRTLLVTLSLLACLPGCFLARAHRNNQALETITTLRGNLDGIPHYLFFGFEGGNGSDGSDGIIALKSQLEEKMQMAAKQVFGFPDDHTAILRSAAVSEKLNFVLAAP